jgi:hypothetical protein
MLLANTMPHMFRNLFASIFMVFAITGCTALIPRADADKADFKSRIQTKQAGNVQVSTSVLSASESRAVYGVALAKKGIQPVWVEVKNSDDKNYWLMFRGMDPYFFPASEAAEAFLLSDSSGRQSKIEQHFQKQAFRNPIPPGATTSGFVLTNLDEGAKMVQVDLVADDEHKSFSFLAFVPGFRADFYRARKKNPHRQHASSGEVKNYTDDEALRTALDALPCCVTDKKGMRNGDPLNLIIIGGVDDAYPALIRRGWRLTEQTWSGSIAKIVRSGLSGDRYPYAPISPLFLYGRPQDLALQKARDNIHRRNHLRLWKSPMRYHGKQVWVGQISRDIGSRFTIHSPYIVTHKIAPDVDESRVGLIEDLAYSQNLAMIGFVKGVGSAPKETPRHNLTKDPYYTDGARAVLIFDVNPKSLAEIEFLPWEVRPGGFIEQTIRKKK